MASVEVGREEVFPSGGCENHGELFESDKLKIIKEYYDSLIGGHTEITVT